MPIWSIFEEAHYRECRMNSKVLSSDNARLEPKLRLVPASPPSSLGICRCETQRNDLATG